MISALIFSNNTSLSNYVRGVCAASAEISIPGSLEDVRTGYAVARQLSAYAPELVLLDVGEEDIPHLTGAVVMQIQTEAPSTAIVPICSRKTPAVKQLVETLGLIAPLSPPFSAADLEAAAISALGSTMDSRRGFLAIFAPSRPGSGATTIALNAAWQLAGNRNFKTLFIEIDDEMGAASILLDSGETQIAASEDPQFLTEASFQQHIRHLGPLHVLTGVRLRALTGMKRWSVLRLVTCGRSYYDFVFVRVPSITHESVKPLLSVARRICIAATPDLPALSMARRRCAELRESAGASRVVLVVNRCNGDLSERHFRHLLDHENVALVPDAPRQVQQSYVESGVVQSGGAFARAIHSVAAAVLGGGDACPPPPPRVSLAALSRLFAHEGT